MKISPTDIYLFREPTQKGLESKAFRFCIEVEDDTFMFLGDGRLFSADTLFDAIPKVDRLVCYFNKYEDDGELQELKVIGQRFEDFWYADRYDGDICLSARKILKENINPLREYSKNELLWFEKEFVNEQIKALEGRRWQTNLVDFENEFERE